ncbi:uncharacterized protein TM35_000671030 [Trypanosoma theileri]|uniref:Mucin-like glycoprotein n=1 Tax=Trypanosoma theileri TaxID=67003 RepID=A0A1X0NFQ6_9TRYP|nr:uncharacterized protein TM35_000671030 [Trypanosoma theileri]ORC83497.1 hypothetical protein TM35_000671030 [Trypanosoma theileri]
MRRVMCVLAVVMCCAYWYTMTAAASSSSSEGGVAHEDLDSSWNDKVEYDKLVGAAGDVSWSQLGTGMSEEGKKIEKYYKCKKAPNHTVEGINCSIWKEFRNGTPSKPEPIDQEVLRTQQQQKGDSTDEIAGVSGPRLQTSGTVAKGSGESSEKATVTEPQSVEKPLDTPDIMTIPAKPISATSSSASAPAETSTISSSSTKENTGSSTSGTDAADNSTSADSNLTQQTPATVDLTAIPDSQGTNSTTPQSPESNVTDTPTTTPSTVPNGGLTTIASAVQKNRPNADSSLSPVWMCTAAPLMIVAVLFSATVY